GMRGSAVKDEDVPAEYRHMLGRFTAEKSAPNVRAFLEAGGKAVTVGSSTNLAYLLGIPVTNALVDSTGKPLKQEQFYAPGSIHRVYADTSDAAGWGMPAEVAVMHSNSPVFRISNASNVKPLAWYGEENPLMSGWIWSPEYLKNGVTAFAAPVGKGMFYAFGQEITFRAQPHGTFKWLFNQLYKSE